MIEKAEFHGGTFEIEGGDKKWTVTVSEQPAGEGGEVTDDKMDTADMTLPPLPLPYTR